MKKLLALITLLAMVFLCACSPETVSDNREDDNSSEKKTVVKEKSEETSDEKDSEDDVEEIAEEPEDEEEFTDGLWKESDLIEQKVKSYKKVFTNLKNML